ncbi:MAG: ABC transporter permease [Bacteroidota bacterium]
MNNQNQVPSRLVLRFFRWYCHPDYVEDIEGDLLERFEKRTDKSLFYARWKLILDVLALFRPGIIRPFEGTQKLNYYGMLQHNIKLTFRNFRRHRSTFLINLIGLSSGLATVFLIYLWITDEISTDRFNANDDQLYRAMVHFKLPDRVDTWDYTSGKLASAMKDEMPEVRESVRVSNKFFRPGGVIYDAINQIEAKGMFASSNLFQVMDYKLISGSENQVLTNKKSVVLSEATAIKLFKSPENAIGKNINWENEYFDQVFEVSGVFQHPDQNLSINFDLVVNYDVLIDVDRWAGDWNGGYAETYLVLQEGTNIDQFNAKIKGYLTEKTEMDQFTLFVQKYSDKYLYGKFENGVLTGGKIENVRLLTIIAIFILVIACINFMNLSTAQASVRMKEIGVKKSLGARKNDLIVQFLVESIIMVFTSLVFALLLTYLILPYFNVLTEKSIVMDLSDQIVRITIFVLVTGLAAGSYPAFYLSGLKPISILKGKILTSNSESWIRKGLVVTQFSIATIFFIGVIIVNRQMNFTQSKNLGYERENILTFSRKGTFKRDHDLFRSELQKIPGVMNVANTAGEFLWGGDNQGGYNWNGHPSNDKHLFKSPKIGYHTIETLGLKLVEGRAFDPNLKDDHSKVILNESAVRMMGLKNPIGKILKNGERSKEIIGVVKDFQYGSMHQKIEPLIFRFRNWGSDYLIKLKPGTEMTTIRQIEDVYSEFHPKFVFEASFLSDDYARLYSSEYSISNIANYMSAIALIISSLGLFGLVAFTIQRKVKEIGIRKVLGCSAEKIILMLSWDFTKMVIVGIILALPISYIVGNQWLQTFAYHIKLDWWIFAISGITALLVAWITVSFQTFKAALANPVESLKDE